MRARVPGGFTAIDLFCGAGGLSLGFSWSGVKIVGAVEEDKWAADTYRTNFPGVNLLNADVQQLSSDRIGNLFPAPPTLLIGGPPCQGFSHANVNNKDTKDPRNSLFREFIRLVKLFRPAACLIENVRGLLTARTAEGRPVIEIVENEFTANGYQTSYRLLNAAHYGIPQIRERVFIVAMRSDLGARYLWPEPTHRYPSSEAQLSFFAEERAASAITLWDAISDLPQCLYGDRDPEESYRNPPSNGYQELMRQNSDGTINNHEPMRHTPRIVERYSKIGYGESESDVLNDLRPRKRGNPELLSSAVYDQNGRRQRPDRPCSTIVASSHTNFIHPYLPRNFTVRELARVQSFPDLFEFKGKRAVLSSKLSRKKGLVEDLFLDQRAQVGNAVPPLLARALAESILECLLA